MIKFSKSNQKTFTSKANTLKFLQSKISKSKIENIYDFTVHEWKTNKKNILNSISKFFSPHLVIVRSSAIGEDSLTSSKAGLYESLLNIKSSSKKQLENSIETVIKSYDVFSPNNQVLIQTQSLDVKVSGVIFTRTLDSGAPYYTINYEFGTSTTGVTHGTANNTIKIFRKTIPKKVPKKWKVLLGAVQEIESFYKKIPMDIEFAITSDNKIIIFQVRPITSIKNEISNNVDSKIFQSILKNKKQFSKLNKSLHLVGQHTIFSDMSDWNPSEIIGNNPNLLDYSLYDFLIMKKIWHKGRTFLGYQNVDPYPLMTKFGSKPYVDIRGSFNSLIPNELSLSSKQKLLKFYFQKLNKNPHFHDKVEFEILFSCFENNIDHRLSELKNHGFDDREIKNFKKILINFTNKIINNFPNILEFCKNLTHEMTNKQSKIISNLESKPKTVKTLLYAAEDLLVNCRDFGTYPFSIMARIAFVSSILLRSSNTNHKHNQQIEDFMNSISTPLSNIQKDIVEYSEKNISKSTFLKKYGHLRPGTYDITASRYDENDDFLKNISFQKKQSPSKSIKLKKSIQKNLEKNGLIFNEIDFSTFVKLSLQSREELKFEFTKSLSCALELIAEAGRIMGFSRDEISNLSIKTILESKNKKTQNTKIIWKKIIEKEKQKNKINNLMTFPSLIYSENDFDVINYFDSQPNYVTSKKISGKISLLSKISSSSQIENKIILIENADPGFDWIFTKNPLGLITKYGGIASHMAIRCAEIKLPAMIGCGEIIFEQLCTASKITLDCKNQQFLILENFQLDNEIEARKVLKSLGYIK